jgi:hypothetical protein
LIGAEGRPAIGELGVDRLGRALRLARVRARRIGQDGWLVADVEGR